MLDLVSLIPACGRSVQRATALGIVVGLAFCTGMVRSAAAQEPPPEPEEVEPNDPIPGPTPCNVALKVTKFSVKLSNAAGSKVDIEIEWTLTPMNCTGAHNVTWSYTITGPRTNNSNTPPTTDLVTIGTCSEQTPAFRPGGFTFGPKSKTCNPRKQSTADRFSYGPLGFRAGDTASVSFNVQCQHDQSCKTGCNCPLAGNKGVVTGPTTVPIPAWVPPGKDK